MDEYYEEPEPTPTFSGGSSGRRGDNVKAAASRVIASRKAISTASRALAVSNSSIQELSKKTIITSSDRPLNTNVNKNSASIKRIMNIQKQFTHLKPPPPIIPEPPKPSSINPQQTAQALRPLEYTPTQPKPQPKPQPTKIIPVIKKDKEYNDIVENTLAKKKELLKTVQVKKIPKTLSYIIPSYKNTIDIKQNTYSDDNLLKILSDNLTDILKSPENSKMIIGEYANYQNKLRKLSEVSHHKDMIELSQTEKRKYFTSDT